MSENPQYPREMPKILKSIEDNNYPLAIELIDKEYRRMFEERKKHVEMLNEIASTRDAIKSDLEELDNLAITAKERYGINSLISRYKNLLVTYEEMIKMHNLTLADDKKNLDGLISAREILNELINIQQNKQGE